MVHANPSKKVDFEDDGFYKFNIEAVDAINKFDNPKNEIILSTSHRFRYNKRKWRKIFIRRGINIHKISIINLNLEHSNTRRMEIENWITIKKITPDKFIIIDDDKSLNGLNHLYKSRLLLTNSYLGLKLNDDFFEFLKNIEESI